MDRRGFSYLLIVLFLPTIIGCGSPGKKSEGTSGRIKIGFLVKQPDEPWFQNEWKFAQQCADSFRFDLVKIGATDGEKVLAAIDNLAAQDARGFVICSPDVRLGPAILAKANNAGLKLMSVDDRFVGADGKFMPEVHHLGISASEIGKAVGRALNDEMRKRGWNIEETALCAATWEELQTARERTDGAIEALTSAGFPKEKVFKAPQKVADIPGAFDAVNILLTQHANVSRWLICGNNDNAVLGAVRAMEGRGYGASNVIGIGINGTDCTVEFQKNKPTGFFASILLAPRRHGFETSQMLYRWIKDGVEPPKETYTTGILITRETYQQVMREQGLL
ncbi:MAG: arabinose ABC transporter substrate-binding protein [Ignavibacteria bacterium]|nr:MAG: arabinose ABC transporter substrate-binding protein [Ignavibacteria bacterium]